MDVEGVLAGYITPSSLSELTAYSTVVDAHLVKVVEVAEQRDFVDVALATKIADMLNELLAQAEQYTGRERALLAGAIRYFADHDDVSGDLVNPTGFEDDAEILNSVCAYLGRPDLVI